MFLKGDWTTIDYSDFNPVNELIKLKFGCTEQCPFCGATCDRVTKCDGTNMKHKCAHHHPKVSIVEQM